MTENAKIKVSLLKDDVHQFDKQSVLKTILKVSIPIVIMMLFNSLYAFVDSMMSTGFVDYGIDTLGQKINGGTVIGVIIPFMGILSAFAIVHTVGAGLAYSKFSAQKNYVEANKAFNQAISFSLISGFALVLIVAIIGIPYMMLVSQNNFSGTGIWGIKTFDPITGELIRAGSSNMLLQSYEYMIAIAIALIPMSIVQTLNRVIRTEGKYLVSLFPLFGLPINIGLDYVFMKILNLGLLGAGLATIVATTFTMIIFIVYLFYVKKMNLTKLTFKFEDFKIQWPIIAMLITFGIGSLLRRVLDSGSSIILSSYVGSIDDVWKNSWTAISRSINLSTMLALGVGQTMSMLISYYSGKNNKEKVNETLFWGLILIIGSNLIAAILMILFEPLIFQGYGGADWWSWNSIYSFAFSFGLLTSLFYSLQMIPIMFYSGLKKPKLSLIHSVFYNIVVIMIYTFGFFVLYQIANSIKGFWVFVSLAHLIAISLSSILFIKTWKQYQVN